jgi:hypothetical protein
MSWYLFDRNIFALKGWGYLIKSRSRIYQEKPDKAGLLAELNNPKTRMGI